MEPSQFDQNNNEESKGKFRFVDQGTRLRGKQTKNRESEEAPSSNEDDSNQLEVVTSRTVQFQFVDLSTKSRRQQAKNRQLVRSHLTKVAKYAERKREVARQDIDPVVTQFFRGLSRTPSPSRISQLPVLDSTISALQTYKGKVTPYFYELLKFHANGIWSALYPSECSSDEPGILAVDWFELARSYPALLHVGCYVGATFADVARGSLFYSVTPEIRMHKIEGIRLIRKELEKGKDIPEAVVLAVMSLVEEASEVLEKRSTPILQEVFQFKPPYFFLQWVHIFLSSRSDPVHLSGLKAIMRAKGGIGQLRERILAFSINFSNILESSFDISAQPYQPYYALPQVLSRINDPLKNNPLNPISRHRGSGFINLLTFGLTQEAVTVMMELLSITVLAENFLEGTLTNPDILALGAMRDRAHLNLLALPTSTMLLLKEGSIYDCCRYSALLFSTGVLFPMPMSTGVPLKLIKEIKKCVDQVGLVALIDELTRPLFIWSLMLTAIAAAGLPEQQWVKEILRDLLTVEGVSRWSEIKKIVESFLWMDFACDGAAMNLWDDLKSQT